MKLLSRTRVNIPQVQKEYVPYEKDVTVNNHLAPSAEHARMLDDFRNQAIDSVVESFVIKDNTIGFEARCIVMNMDWPSNCYLVIVRFSINDHKKTFRYEVPVAEVYDYDLQTVYRKIWSYVIEGIVDDMLKHSDLVKINITK